MSAKTPIGSNLKLFRAKKKLLKDFITNDPYLSGELGNYKHGTLLPPICSSEKVRTFCRHSPRL